MYAGGIEWLDAAAESSAPEAGAGVVTLFVSRHFPQPLVLPGHFTTTQVDAHDRGDARPARLSAAAHGRAPLRAATSRA